MKDDFVTDHSREHSITEAFKGKWRVARMKIKSRRNKNARRRDERDSREMKNAADPIHVEVERPVNYPTFGN